jgi:hypothetical protein
MKEGTNVMMLRQIPNKTRILITKLGGFLGKRHTSRIYHRKVIPKDLQNFNATNTI